MTFPKSLMARLALLVLAVFLFASTVNAAKVGPSSCFFSLVLPPLFLVSVSSSALHNEDDSKRLLHLVSLGGAWLLSWMSHVVMARLQLMENFLSLILSLLAFGDSVLSHTHRAVPPNLQVALRRPHLPRPMPPRVRASPLPNAM